MLNYSQVDDQWRSSMNLKPLIINHSSVFLNAVWNCDVEGVKQSFRTGLARPTDYVLDVYGGGVVPWTKVGFRHLLRSYILKIKIVANRVVVTSG